METRGRRVHAIEKAIFLLDCFWEARQPLSMRKLEKKTGWAKSTIHGLLASMLDSGVVEQNSTDGKYRLGYHQQSAYPVCGGDRRFVGEGQGGGRICGGHFLYPHKQRHGGGFRRYQ